MKISTYLFTGATKVIHSLNEKITLLTNHINEASESLHKIQNGTLHLELSDAFKATDLGNSIESLKAHLTDLSKESEIRNWSNIGLATFSEILRNNTSENLTTILNEILSKLIHYIGANQGAIFVADNGLHPDKKLNLLACYAYDRKKYTNKSVFVGEGLVGQCFLEKEPIYMTKVPANYVQITSGLGEATPTAILLTPLISNDIVWGVIEIASFIEFKPYQKEFMLKISESIASSIKTISEYEQNQVLLKESQQLTEDLRTQEEELRQNIEEMHATQEALQRKNEEIVKLSVSSSEMNGIINGINATMATIEFTLDGTILTTNENFLKCTKYTLDQLTGNNHKMLVPVEDSSSENYLKFWDTLAAGKPLSGVFKRIDSNNEDVWINACYSPIYNSENEIVKVVKFATDITKQIESENEIKLLLEDSKKREADIQQINNQIEEILAQKTGELKIREEIFGKTTILSEADIYGNILYVNSKLLEVSKYSKEELIGKPHSIFRHEDMPKELFKLFWQTIKKGEQFNAIIKNKAKDGSHYWVDGCFFPIKNNDGSIVKFIGSRHHILDDDIAIMMYKRQNQKYGFPLI